VYFLARGCNIVEAKAMLKGKHKEAHKFDEDKFISALRERAQQLWLGVAE
jgi:hypothetical protein